MGYQFVKQVESDLKKVIRGNINNNIELDYDLIDNNPFYTLKNNFEGELKDICRRLSTKMSNWVRLFSEEHIKTGKKVNPYLNFQVSEKVNLIKRLMKRIMHGLGVNSNSVWSTNQN
jgi:hypothetical protein